MNQKSVFLLLIVCFFGSLSISAQNVDNTHDGFLHCGTDQQLHKVFANHPELKAEFELNQTRAEEQDAIDFRNGYQPINSTEKIGNSSQMTPPTYIIPIVFHIIHDYGTENISDAQILDQVRILNTDYRRLNADTISISPAFLAIATDAKIEFRLANIDPNGNCTNGIDRIFSSETYSGDDDSKLNYWPRNKYLNVWVVKSISISGVAGYAYLPGTAPSASKDGIIIVSTYIGSIGTGNPQTSRALTHEVGHFLNLTHLWGLSNNPGITCGNDGVTDTPVTKGWVTCPAFNASHICNANIEENIQNFMEYSYCTKMFSSGQRTRMYSALGNTLGQRNQLSTVTNWAATGVNNNPPNTCAPTADFLPSDKVFICVGGSVTFDDISWKGHPTSWSWSFPGGTPSTSNDSIPVIVYNTAGVYAVTLTASNSSGSNTLSRTALVKVSSTTAQYSAAQYFEGLESAAVFTTDWTVVNAQGNGWTRVTTAAATGTASVKLTNTESMLGTVDEMVSPSINIDIISNPVFTFKLAFRQRTATDNDRLRVYVSTNCGLSWSQRYSKSGATLSTGAATTSSNFVPGAAEWRTETVSIPNVLNSTNVRIKFTFESEGGNNIYIDNINISGPTGINVPDAGIQHFDVYPNPIQEQSIVTFSLDHSQKVNLQLFDMTGRVIAEIFSGTLSEGAHQFPVQGNNFLLSGMYFVKLTTSEGRSATQKLLVN